MCAGLKLLDGRNQISFIFRSHVQLIIERLEFKKWVFVLVSTFYRLED